MKILHVMDGKDYNPEWKTFFREAVRAVIIKDSFIALVKSKAEGFFKFPGGGIEKDESHFDALVREAKEETGLNIITQSITELGMIQELRKSIHGEEIFKQKSYYYYADVDNSISNQKLDDYERDLEFELSWVDIKVAYHTNTELGKNKGFSFLLREAYILKYLLSNRGIRQ